MRKQKFIMSHVALRVTDLDRMLEFYKKIFDMNTKWHFEGVKTYLTTGNQDSLALIKYPHDDPHSTQPKDLPYKDSVLDHFGFIVNTKSELEGILNNLQQKGLRIWGPKTSRDRAISFYVADPEDNIIQILYTPRMV